MPLPRSSEDFLECALSYAKKGTVIHFYDFLSNNEFNSADQKINKACKKKKLKYKLFDLVKCGQFSPHVFRICADFTIR